MKIIKEKGMVMNSVNVFKALADKTRQRILRELKSGEQCASVLLDKLNISQSTLSHHMQVLSKNGVVKCRRDGKWSYYSIDKDAINEIEDDIVSLKPKPQYYDEVIKLCLSEKSKNPIKIFNRLANLPCFGMMGVFHHILVGSALLTAYKNCGKNIDLKKSLIELQNRAEKVPPMSCVKNGACGAAISAGIFISIAKDVALESNEFFGLANGMTAKVLKKIKNTGGPRCCKRHSYFALLEGAKYSNKHLGTKMKTSKIKCKRSVENKLCIKNRCPFNN